MTDSEHDTVPAASSWDTYWRGTHEAAAYSAGGVAHPAIAAFWDALFGEVAERRAAPAIVDLAAGNGAVAARALGPLAGRPAQLVCVDVSRGAVRDLQARHRRVRGVIADARAVPLAAARFDAVTSQFGLEYAGREAVAEAARLVAPGGRLALLMHHADGGIYRECAANLDAIRELRRARFLPLARRMFEAGFAALRGAGGDDYVAAAKRLEPAFRALESIMERHGRHVAGDTVRRLYLDVDRIHSRMRRYDGAEVLDWLARMEAELPAYAERMDSMCAAALDEPAFSSICAELSAQGFGIERAAPLVPQPDARPLAWALVARAVPDGRSR